MQTSVPLHIANAAMVARVPTPTPLVHHMRLMWLASGLQGALQPLVSHSTSGHGAPHVSLTPPPSKKNCSGPPRSEKFPSGGLLLYNHCEEAVYRDMKCDDVHLPDCSNAIACPGCAAPKACHAAAVGHAFDLFRPVIFIGNAQRVWPRDCLVPFGARRISKSR